MRIVRHRLKITDPTPLADFYTNLLGMHDFGPADTPLFGYDETQCLLELRQADVAPFRASNNDFYWKIGITLRDLDVAVTHLKQQGWPVSEPQQFLNIGYMSHLRDSLGFPIELLQQGFEGCAAPAPAGHPIGAQATLSHITLRVTNIEQAKDYFVGKLGMRLMSIQPVQGRDFTLYFYTWSEETLPNPDLNSVENREWLWARPYALIELQHLEMPGATLRWPEPDESGFDGFGFSEPASNAITYVSLEDLAEII